ncbi:MAG TPA: septal ring lytic transglycosylase RlpA family protein [Solirubrobacteraceae bacterium]
MLAVPTSAVALTAGQADAQSAIQINVPSDHVAYAHPVTVKGSAPVQDAGQTLQVQFSPAGGNGWQRLGSTRIAGDGHFRFVTPLRRSGELRAVPAAASAPRSGVTPTGSAVTDSSGGASLSPSSAHSVSVGSKLSVRQRSISTLDGHAVHVLGHLYPSIAGRKVRLEGRSGGQWRLLSTDRTAPSGAFNIRYRPTSTTGAGGEQLRVRFRGDEANRHAVQDAGKVTSFTESVASWYDDGGSTACGFHAGMGVANKSLPCGTKVTFRYGGRTVTATVDDRGPYVGGRTWDLNQTTAGALGFGGVGTVWSTS